MCLPVILYCFVCFAYLNFQFLDIQTQQSIKLASNPNISPNGSQIVFSWRGDIWIPSIEGDVPKQLTLNLAKDIQPKCRMDQKLLSLVIE